MLQISQIPFLEDAEKQQKRMSYIDFSFLTTMEYKLVSSIIEV